MLGTEEEEQRRQEEVTAAEGRPPPEAVVERALKVSIYGFHLILNLFVVSVICAEGVCKVSETGEGFSTENHGYESDL